MVHTTYVISPTLLNEAAFNYNGNRIQHHSVRTGFTLRPTSPSTACSLDRTSTTASRPSICRASPGPNYTSNWMPWNNKADDYQIRDDVSWTKGAHQLKIGFSWALYKKDPGRFRQHPGQLHLQRLLTRAYDFADFLSATPSTTQRTPSRSPALEQHLLGCLRPGQLARKQPADLEPRPALGWRSAHLRSQPPSHRTSIPTCTTRPTPPRLTRSGNICSAPTPIRCAPAGPSPGSRHEPQSHLARVTVLSERHRHRRRERHSQGSGQQLTGLISARVSALPMTSPARARPSSAAASASCTNAFRATICTTAL